MKYKHNGEWKELKIKPFDSLPIDSIIEYDGDTVPEGYEEVYSNIDYIVVGLSDNKTINKSVSYGSVDIPFDRIFYQSDNSDFVIKNDRVYYNGTKRALIQVNYNITTTIQGYLLGGNTNGSYKGIISCTPNDLSGNSANGSSLIVANPGEYLTCAIGRAAAFSGEAVYKDSKMDACVLAYLN